MIGKHNLKSKLEKDYRVYLIEKFIVHPEWKPHRKKYDADISLIFLQKPIEFNKKVMPICLPPQMSDSSGLVGSFASIAGWGTSEENRPIAEAPSIIELTIISEDACVSEDYNFEIVMSHRTFCTAGNYQRGPCKGWLIFSMQSH